MQFGREPLLQAHSAMRADGEPGWICSVNAGHFQLASQRARPQAATSTAPQARWDDDGGATPGEQKNGPRLAPTSIGLV
jgi:hypothetical protein